MAAADKLGGYANGFGELNAETLAANVTDDYKLLDKDGNVVEGPFNNTERVITVMTE